MGIKKSLSRDKAKNSNIEAMRSRTRANEIRCLWRRISVNVCKRQGEKIIISFHWCFTIVSVWHARDTLNYKNEGRMRVMLKPPVLKTRIWFFRPEGPTSPSILFWKEHMTFLNWSSRVLKFERASFWYLFHCNIYYPSFKNAAKKQWKITYYIC